MAETGYATEWLRIVLPTPNLFLARIVIAME
jgi:hypothetical protein